MGGQTRLCAITNETGVALQWMNREFPQDSSNPALPTGADTLTFGGNGVGCDIPDCSDAEYWGTTGAWTPASSQQHRMVIRDTQGGTRFWWNIFKIEDQVYVSSGDTGFPQPQQQIPADPGLTGGGNVQVRLTAGENGQLTMSAFVGSYRNPTALDSATALAKLQAYAPRIYLDSNEVNFPTSIEWYLQRVTMHFQDTVYSSVITSSVSLENINCQTGSLGLINPTDYYSHFMAMDDGIWQIQPFWLTVKDDATYAGEATLSADKKTLVGAPPVYGSIIDNPDKQAYDLLYAFFYAYNGRTQGDRLPGIGIGTHEGDWEHIIVRVKNDWSAILGVFMQAHGSDDQWSIWYYPPGTANNKSYQAQGNRITVYAGLGGHASYAAKANYDYGLFRGADSADGNGALWDPGVEYINPVLTQWLQYSGRFGSWPSPSSVGNPPPSPLGQYWFNPRTDGPSATTAPLPAGATWITDWIIDNPALATRKLQQFCMPASHDAGASLRSFGTMGATSDNAVTQSGQIFMQLCSGVRFIDLRPVLWKSMIGNDTLYLGHFSLPLKFAGITGQTVADALGDVARFLGQPACKNEFVILYFSHWYNIDVDSSLANSAAAFPMDRLISELQTILGSYLYTDPGIPNQRQNDVLSQKQIKAFAGKAIAVFDGLPRASQGNQALPFLQYRDPSAGIFSYWKASGQTSQPLGGFADMIVFDSYANTDDYDDMVADQLKKLQANAGTGDMMFLLSWTLTLSVVEIALGTDSIEDLARPANAQLENWLAAQILAGTIKLGRIPNFLYCDFAEAQYRLVEAARGINNLVS